MLGGRVGDVEARIGAEGWSARGPRSRGGRRESGRWELVLDDVVAHGSHRLVLEDQELVAQVDGRLEASLDSRLGRWIELPAVRLHGTGFVRRDGAPVLEPLTVDGSGRFVRFDPRARSAVDKLEAFEGTIELSGTLRESGALGARLPEGVSIVRGGTVRATLDLQRGRLGPGTELDLLDTRARGRLAGLRRRRRGAGALPGAAGRRRHGGELGRGAGEGRAPPRLCRAAGRGRVAAGREHGAGAVPLPPARGDDDGLRPP